MLNGSKQRGSRISLAQAEDHTLQTWLGMARICQRMQRQLDRVLDSAGLSLPQFDVLANLGMTEGITQQELAEKLLVTKGNVCGLLDRMESAGLVERRSDPKDRRANRVYLTRTGRSALQEAFPVHLGLIQQSFAGLSTGEQRTLNQIINRLDESDTCA